MHFTRHEAGALAYQQTGTALSDDTVRAAGKADAILLGAMGLPHVRYPDGTEISPQLDLREHFELYAGVRPIRPLKGLPTKLADPRAAEIDFVLVREQTEGLFFERTRTVMKGDEEARDAMVITRARSTRVFDFALRLAERRKARGGAGRVTCVDKANVLGSMAFFRRVFEDRARAFPQVVTECAYVDAMALNLVMKPWAYDVLVTENMFGDILTDEASTLAGSMGMLPSASLAGIPEEGKGTFGLYEPIHGSAPTLTGQNAANPLATILSVAMMLRYSLALEGEAKAVEKSVEATLNRGFRTGDIMSEGKIKVGTKEMGDAVVKGLGAG
jgi:3-isopropylmalate dehydrogenase